MAADPITDSNQPSDTALIAEALHQISHDLHWLCGQVRELLPVVAAYQNGGKLAARIALKRSTRDRTGA